jgi:hypothetical protein
MDITDSSLRWTSWGDAPDPSMSAPGLPRDEAIMRYSYMLLYVMTIISRCVISLILMKCYVNLRSNLIAYNLRYYVMFM